MQSGQRLSERLVTKSYIFGPEDPLWAQFVRDHKTYIKKQCQRMKFIPENLVPYRYRPEDFVVDHEGDVPMTWIFLFINDIRDPAQFTEACTELYIFNRDVIRVLKRMYTESASYIPDEREVD